ncbi:MAG: HEAT repeat domain-containing protein [Gemmatimonadota bacterium]|nr:HEAT repeat domain-containing protein [Gemmatimonadota bacterium]
MKTGLRAAGCGLVLLAIGAPTTQGQSLASRVNAVRDGRVHFTFAAREGVCGNGRSFISIGSDVHIGSYSSMSDGRVSEPCERGPVRVVLDRADGGVIDVNTYVGRARDGSAGAADAGTSLGMVRAAEAAQYLLGLAATVDGKPGRDAILPAVLADSVDVTPQLVAIARDEARPRETRRSAISWAGRQTDVGGAAARVAEALVRIARNENDNNGVREQALQTLARLDHGAGIPALVELARSGSDTWLTRESVQALAQSGDPRARGYLRSIVERADLPDEVLAIAIRGVGREFATPRDAELLRQVYPKLTSERTKRSVLGTLAELGGSENERWLLGVARDENERQSIRQHALQHARRAGASIGELVALYDRTNDPRMKEILISVYVESGEKAATDKLLAILRSEESPALRRRAINQLSRSDDPRVKEALQKILDQ